MHLNDALLGEARVTPVATLHEQAAAIAAESYARVSGGLGVCMVTTGPGGTNAVTGCVGAWLDSSPVLFLSGQVKRADSAVGTGLRQFGVQEVDIVSIVSSCTKYAVRVTDPADLRREVERAIACALSGRRGPAWIDIPLDVQGARVDPASLAPWTEPSPSAPRPREVLAAEVADALAALRSARRPVIIAGNGVRLAGAVEEFAAFVDRVGAPALFTWLGLDLLPDDHPLVIGRPGSIAPRAANFTLQNADLIVSLGARLDMAMTGYAHERFARDARKVIVDIDPAEIAKLKMTHVTGVEADAGEFLREALGQLRAAPEATHGAWVARCAEWKQRYPLVPPAQRALPERVSTYHFSEVLSEELAEGDIVAPGSSGAGLEIFLLCFKVKRGQRVFHNRGLGAMGYGPPSALGACIASGGRRTVCVDGDGGFQMNVQELQTVSRLGLPIKFFVLSNEGYASIRSSQSNHFGRLVGADATSGLTLPPLDKIADAYGIPYARIERGDTLRDDVRRVLEAEGPVLCEVLTPASEPRMPSLRSERRPDGSMESKPLEDLWPFLDREELQQNMRVEP